MIVRPCYTGELHEASRRKRRLRLVSAGLIFTAVSLSALAQAVLTPPVTADNSAQVNYAIGSGRSKGLTICFEGSNLNDAPLITYGVPGDQRLPINWQKYGAAYRWGVTYRF
jgi:hypothetical protein